MENKNYIWRPVSEYTGGRVLATNGLDVLIGEINPEGDCESEEDGSTVLCGITGFVKIEDILPELTECEDEKIRKQIKAFIKSRGSQITQSKTDAWLEWLEKQGEQKPVDNKLPEFKDKLCELFQRFRWYKDETPTNGDILEYVEAHIQELLGVVNEQKPADKPKFKVGNWYQCTKDFFGKGVTFDKNTAYYCAKEGCLQNKYGCHIAIVKDLYDNFKLWTIQDAKDGDVLYSLDSYQPFIYKERKPFEQATAHCGINMYGKFFVCNTKDCIITLDKYIPATKEQHDILFSKMKEAGYEWDTEKKELRKIKQNPTEWSEEDEKMVNDIIAAIDTLYYHGMVNWLKSLKDRVQPKQEWSEKDENIRLRLIDYLYGKSRLTKDREDGISWLKSLRPQPHWKQSDDHDIEYTRTDAFIEKAVEFINKANLYLYHCISEECDYVDTDEFIKDFKKYMKGK